MFLHTFHPSPVLFQAGPVVIHWYSIVLLLAIGAGVLVVRTFAVQRKLATAAQVYDLGFVVILAALIGARLYAVLLFWREYAQHPLEIFKVWHGGMAIHGALIGGAAALWWFGGRKARRFLQWGDIIAPALAIGQTIGRWGNYFNQELFGPPTGLPWGIPIDAASRPAEFASSEYFHPAFLYESFLNLGLFVLLVWMLKKPRRTGAVGYAYLIGYGVIRFAMEFVRLDVTPVVAGIRWPIVVSVVLVMAGCAGLFIKPRSTTPIP